ncbi:aquaporin-like protein [Syncephalis plumigaleata]|nr:aquaporin-like protein [Syncephalis plumigaleata]
MSNSNWKFVRTIRRLQYDCREYLAEFLGTMVFLILGLAANAQYTLNVKATDSFAPCFIWGLAIICGVYIGRRVSGAHLNPAVTLALCLFRGFPVRKVFGYWLVQILAGSAAAMVVYGCFISSIHNFDGGVRQWEGDQATSNIFYVHPSPGVSFANHFLSEFMGTLILMVTICAVTDRRNNFDSDIVLPIVLGFTVTCLLVALGFTTGLSLNPARELGPRIFGLFVYGGSAFSNNHFFFWIPVFAPVVGALCGSLVYDIFVPSTPLGEEYTMETGEIVNTAELATIDIHNSHNNNNNNLLPTTSITTEKVAGR